MSLYTPSGNCLNCALRSRVWGPDARIHDLVDLTFKVIYTRESRDVQSIFSFTKSKRWTSWRTPQTLVAPFLPWCSWPCLGGSSEVQTQFSWSNGSLVSRERTGLENKIHPYGTGKETQKSCLYSFSNFVSLSWVSPGARCWAINSIDSIMENRTQIGPWGIQISRVYLRVWESALRVFYLISALTDFWDIQYKSLMWKKEVSTCFMNYRFKTTVPINSTQEERKETGGFPWCCSALQPALWLNGMLQNLLVTPLACWYAKGAAGRQRALWPQKYPALLFSERFSGINGFLSAKSCGHRKHTHWA